MCLGRVPNACLCLMFFDFARSIWRASTRPSKRIDAVTGTQTSMARRFDPLSGCDASRWAQNSELGRHRSQGKPAVVSSSVRGVGDSALPPRMDTSALLGLAWPRMHFLALVRASHTPSVSRTPPPIDRSMEGWKYGGGACWVSTRQRVNNTQTSSAQHHHRLAV